MKIKILIVILFFLMDNFAEAKRSAPKIVEDIIVGERIYSVSYERNTDYLIAYVVEESGDKVIYKKQVYKIIFDKNKEQDVQDEYIDQLLYESGSRKLKIHRENGEVYFLEVPFND